MSKKYFKRFCKIKTLQPITPKYLLDFLEPYGDWLQKHGFDINQKDDDGNLDYKTLQSVLIKAPEDMPPEFIDSIFKVCEVGTEENYDKLKTYADLKNIVLKEDPSELELALVLFLKDRKFIDKCHREIILVKDQSFVYLGTRKSTYGPVMNAHSSVIEKMRQAMNDEHESDGKGGIYSIELFTSAEENKAFFLITHGEATKAVSANKQGKSKTVVYRPEECQIVIYDMSSGSLAIKRKSSAKEIKRYQTYIGEYIFGSHDYFVETDYFHFLPLFEKKEDALACSNIEGMISVKLVEVKVFWGGEHKKEHRYRSKNIFASEKSFDNFKGKIQYAIFEIEYENCDRPRKLKIERPNIAKYNRQEDAYAVELWLRKQEFVKHTIPN